MSNVPHAPAGDRTRRALRSKTGGLTKVGGLEVETRTGRDMFEVQQVWMAKICKKCKINLMHTSDKGDRARPAVCTVAKPDTRRRCEREDRKKAENKRRRRARVVSSSLQLPRVLDDLSASAPALDRLPPPSRSPRSPPPPSETLDALIKLLPT
ncbi:hypothetical protein C8T65DRAFT_746300 [Cerioporus squamosus]|nr:hypothetical protein C8T65DRAFT_746300 [Cerioporus squamosus]